MTPATLCRQGAEEQARIGDSDDRLRLRAGAVNLLLVRIEQVHDAAEAESRETRFAEIVRGQNQQVRKAEIRILLIHEFLNRRAIQNVIPFGDDD